MKTVGRVLVKLVEHPAFEATRTRSFERSTIRARQVLLKAAAEVATSTSSDAFLRIQNQFLNSDNNLKSHNHEQ